MPLLLFSLAWGSMSFYGGPLASPACYVWRPLKCHFPLSPSPTVQLQRAPAARGQRL